MKPSIELTIRYGQFGEKAKTVALQIGEDLMRELMEPVERSDDAFSLFVSSRRGRDAVAHRKKTLHMRKALAEQIARQMVPAIVEAFSVNDQLDGYRIDELSPEERAFHKSKGRL